MPSADVSSHLHALILLPQHLAPAQTQSNRWRLTQSRADVKGTANTDLPFF